MNNIKIWSITLMLLSGIILWSCNKDDEVKIPEVSFESASYNLNETSTSTLEVKVILNMNAPQDLIVKFTISGTAVANVNYQAIADNSVTIPTGSSEAIIFVNAINEPIIEGDKTIEFTLESGDNYILASTNKVATVMIEDNEVASGNAPVVQFTSDHVTTNAFLQDTVEVRVGLDKAFSSTTTIPISFGGTAEMGIDYEVLDLTSLETVDFAAGDLSLAFKIAVKYNAIEDLNKTVEITFPEPMLTDYKVSETNDTISINIIDPAADFSAWFNEITKYTEFYSGGTASVYRDDLYAYNIKRYYWNSIEEGGKYSILTGEHSFFPSIAKYNSWVEVINIHQRLIGFPYVNVPEEERWEIQTGGEGDFFGLSRFFGNLAEYGKTLIESENGWLRFVALNSDASEGKVIVPAQTLTLYKVKPGFDWQESFIASDGVEDYRAWYADSNTTQGHLGQSTNVETTQVVIHGGEGTYSNASEEIIFEVTFTCDDPDFNIDPKYYISNDGDTYTMKIKYVKP